MKLPPPSNLESVSGIAAYIRRLVQALHAWSVDQRTNALERTFTPVLLFGGSNVGMTARTFGRYTRIGDLIIATFRVSLSAMGTSTGNAAIEGFPGGGTLVGSGRAHPVVVFGYVGGMAGLTSPLTGWMGDEASGLPSRMNLYDHGATGVTVVDDTNFTNTSDIIGTVTYTAKDPVGL
jgi:hypothetical protein